MSEEFEVMRKSEKQFPLFSIFLAYCVVFQSIFILILMILLFFLNDFCK